MRVYVEIFEKEAPATASRVEEVTGEPDQRVAETASWLFNKINTESYAVRINTYDSTGTVISSKGYVA